MVKSIFAKSISRFFVILTLYFINTIIISNTFFIQQSYASERKQKVNNNECLNIESFIFKGNINFSDIRLKMRMKSWHSSLLPGNLNCYNEEWLKKDILAIVEFYRKQGFPDVEIDHAIKTDEKNTKKGKVKIAVEINIDEGLAYKIVFKGNSFFSERELKKKVDLVKKGNSNDTALSKAKIEIKNIYIDAGFQDITVEFNKTREDKSQTKKGSKKSDNDLWTVEFLINEGRRTVVNQLDIKGNKMATKDEILDSMLTRQKGTLEKGGYNSDVLDKDINAIELLYLSKGFLNAKIVKQITTVPAKSTLSEQTPQSKRVSET
ncbi:MAG: hypothetical protein HQK73_08005, partial [Desulfamplus sp.]|nr:hypothetical protein [Desulfamplus sp.]